MSTDGSRYEPIAIEHVARPDLPWRQATRTECGLAIKGQPVITREQLIQKAKAMGDLRARLTTCGTCVDTFQRWPSWDEDPAQSLQREINWTRPWSRRRGDDADRDLFQKEMRAMAILIARHRSEFDELIVDQEETVPLKQARRAAKPRRHLPPKW